MRVSVIVSSLRERKNEKFVMRFSGVMIFILSIVLCGIVYLTIEQFGAVKYHEIAMITIVMYTFTKLSLAIWNLIKSRKYYRAYEKALCSIAFTDGVVEGYTKIEDKFVDRYLTKNGETVEEARKDLKDNGIIKTDHNLLFAFWKFVVFYN